MGWWVRVRGHPFRLFSDRKYGGKFKSLKAAIKYRDSLPVEDIHRVRFYPKPSKRNKSGRVGVSEIKGRNDLDTMGWRVVWCEPIGVQQSHNFLVSTYNTSRAARNAAVKFRESIEYRLSKETKNV